MGDGVGDINLMMTGEIVVQAELGIEEVECVVNHILAVGVGTIPGTRMLRLVADVTVL